MADTAVASLTGISSPASDDELYIVDISDTTDGADGTSRKITWSSLFTAPVIITSLDMNAAELILDADGDTTITADTDDQIDIKISNADDFKFTANTFTALSGSSIATNTITETTAASGVTIDGTLIKDYAIKVNTVSEHTAASGVTIDGVKLKDGGISLGASGHLLDANDLEVLKFTQTASAVNEITVVNAIANSHPYLIASGGDTNINLDLKPKGTGVVRKYTDVQFVVVDFTTNTSTGDGKYYFRVPETINGMNLVAVHGEVITAGTTGTTDIQIYNVTDSQDMLSTVLTIDSGETGSDTAAAAVAINGSYDDVATNDILRIDIDAVSTTPAKGLILTLSFDLP